MKLVKYWDKYIQVADRVDNAQKRGFKKKLNLRSVADTVNLGCRN